MRRAVEHLATLGHTDITYVAGPEASWSDGMRWRALREAAHELMLTEHRVGPVEPTVAGGHGIAPQLLARRCGAVIAYNDLVAIGVMRGLAELGARVPQDVSVVGFDNGFGSDLVHPALSTVAAPLQSLGEAAVRHVVHLIGTRPHARPTDAFLVPVTFIERESTAPATLAGSGLSPLPHITSRGTRRQQKATDCRGPAGPRQ